MKKIFFITCITVFIAVISVFSCVFALDYSAEIKISPLYFLKYESSPMQFSTSVNTDDITVWVNGGTETLKLSNGKAQKNDYKSKQLLVSSKKNGIDYDYTKENTKLLGKNAPKFKWIVTEENVSDPFEAYCSKTAQTKGKLLASCSNGKLVAGKVPEPTNGKVWAFDQNGGFGYSVFKVEVAPSQLFVSKVKLSESDFDNGRLTNQSKDKALKTITANVKEPIDFVVTPAYFYKGNGEKTTKFYSQKSQISLNVKVSDNSVVELNGVDSYSNLSEGNSFKITALVGNPKSPFKPGNVNLTVVCRQTQKKLTLKIITMPYVTRLEWNPTAVTISQGSSSSAVYDVGNIVAYCGMFSGSFNELQVVAVNQNITPEIIKEILNDNKEFSVSNLPDKYKTNDYSAKLKGFNRIELTVNNNCEKSEYYVLVVANSKEVITNGAPSYPGIICGTEKIIKK